MKKALEAYTECRKYRDKLKKDYADEAALLLQLKEKAKLYEEMYNIGETSIDDSIRMQIIDMLICKIKSNMDSHLNDIKYIEEFMEESADDIINNLKIGIH